MINAQDGAVSCNYQLSQEKASIVLRLLNNLHPSGLNGYTAQPMAGL
jgi:hypothetical protein